MVLTRRSIKAEFAGTGPTVIEESTVVTDVAEPPIKRRKTVESEGPTGQVKVSITTTLDAEPAGAAAKPVKAAKRKVRPKLLQTAHTEDNLPAIQAKAAKVQGSRATQSMPAR